jgi:hypothetical protein
MLEIVWRNPKRLVQARVIVDRTSRYNPETGQAEIIYRTKGGMGGEDVEYELVLNSRQPMHGAA